MKTSTWIAKILEELFPDPEVPLHYKDPFTLLVAVMLSAQCTDEKVNRVTPGLFALADTPEKMGELSQEEIEQVIRSLGLYRTKAKHLKELSKILVARHGGRVPGSLEELERLPGVGHKTASVVMIHAFNVPAFPVDTHVHRLAARWGLSSGKDVKTTEEDLKRLFPKNRWSTLSLQIILFGRTYCPARGHNPQKCPICSKIKQPSKF